MKNKRVGKEKRMIWVSLWIEQDSRPKSIREKNLHSVGGKGVFRGETDFCRAREQKDHSENWMRVWGTCMMTGHKSQWAHGRVFGVEGRLKANAEWNGQSFTEPRNPGWEPSRQSCLLVGLIKRGTTCAVRFILIVSRLIAWRCERWGRVRWGVLFESCRGTGDSSLSSLDFYMRHKLSGLNLCCSGFFFHVQPKQIALDTVCFPSHTLRFHLLVYRMSSDALAVKLISMKGFIDPE